MIVQYEDTPDCVWTISIRLQGEDGIIRDAGYIQQRYDYYDVERIRLTHITQQVAVSSGFEWYTNLLERVAKDIPTSSHLLARIQDRDQYVTVPQALETLSKWYMLITL